MNDEGLYRCLAAPPARTTPSAPCLGLVGLSRNRRTTINHIET